MPYVPSKKTDGKSTDREQLDLAVETLAREAATRITNNLSLIRVYRNIFASITSYLTFTPLPTSFLSNEPAFALAQAILEVGSKYEYEGAFLGELNYSITRFIQRVPQIKVERKEWAQEIRYWLYAATVEALTLAANQAQAANIGVGGVFEDIKDEYKRRVNTAYEAEQILKSGDCYDTPYYTRLVRVVKEDGTLVGHQEVMLKRSDETLNVDLLFGDVFGEVVLKRPTK
jgi:hypothetical protein